MQTQATFDFSETAIFDQDFDVVFLFSACGLLFTLFLLMLGVDVSMAPLG